MRKIYTRKKYRVKGGRSGRGERRGVKQREQAIKRLLQRRQQR
jgi:hypothetical protein